MNAIPITITAEIEVSKIAILSEVSLNLSTYLVGTKVKPNVLFFIRRLINKSIESVKN